jgi:ribosomal protein L11 methyltransferase
LKSGYYQIDFELPEALAEAVLAVLASEGYQAFEERESGLSAYISDQEFKEEKLDEILKLWFPKAAIRYSVNWIAPRNWNREWEENYPSVYIDTFCQIVPSFREPKPGYSWTLVIQPKMSFGTGHHETTRLMILQMKEIDFKEKDVLDMGCGTGILGILAHKMGAAKVTGIDIDPWSYENAGENISLNQTEVEILIGDVEKIPDRKFDIVIANINRNVLLADGMAYIDHLKPGGNLLISGFLDQDEANLEEYFTGAGLCKMSRKAERNWISLLFQKN